MTISEYYARPRAKADMDQARRYYAEQEALKAAKAELESKHFHDDAYTKEGEKEIDRLRRRLYYLYDRRDKLEYLNRSRASSADDENGTGKMFYWEEGPDPRWEKFKQTKTWRGLEYDIKTLEDRLDRLEGSNK